MVKLFFLTGDPKKTLHIKVWSDPNPNPWTNLSLTPGHIYTPHIGEPTHTTAHLHKLFTPLKTFRVIFVTCTTFQRSIIKCGYCKCIYYA